jgi:hypothetical protein
LAPDKVLKVTNGRLFATSFDESRQTFPQENDRPGGSGVHFGGTVKYREEKWRENLARETKTLDCSLKEVLRTCKCRAEDMAAGKR